MANLVESRELESKLELLVCLKACCLINWGGSEQDVMAAAGRVVSSVGPRVRKAALEITEAAANRIQSLLSHHSPPALGVRVGLKQRGCNGMAYTLNYAERKDKFDEEVSERGVTVFIDPRALMHIIGTRMDYVDNETVSEFIFDNPNAKGTCGCGESFNV